MYGPFGLAFVKHMGREECPVLVLVPVPVRVQVPAPVLVPVPVLVIVYSSTSTGASASASTNARASINANTRTSTTFCVTFWWPFWHVTVYVFCDQHDIFGDCFLCSMSVDECC